MKAHGSSRLGATFAAHLTAAAFATIFFACSGGAAQSAADSGASGAPNGDDAGASDVAASGDASVKGSGTSPNGALTIVQLSSTVPTVTLHPTAAESDTVELVAIVTDQAGLDAIAGGTLTDDTGATYGAFGAGAQKGTYTASISFTQMSAIRSVDFPSTGGSRTFVAHFFDNGGNTASANVTITLRCRAVLGLVGACGGICSDTTNDITNCGACGNACTSKGTGMNCAAGACVAHYPCVSTNAPPVGDCMSVCAQLGLSCSNVIAYGRNDCTGNAVEQSSTLCDQAFQNFQGSVLTLGCGCE